MPSFPPYIHHCTLDDQFLLFDERSSQIQVLNTTASYVCARWLAGAGAAAIADELNELTGAPRKTIRRDTAALLHAWSQPALSLASSQDAPDWGTNVAGEPRVYTLASRAPVPRRDGAFRRRYRLLDFEFFVEADPGVAVAIDGLLGHLAADAGAARDDLCLFTVERATTEGGWRLRIDGHEIGTCADEDEIVPLVHANTLIMAYKNTECLSVLHAAAIGRNGRGILMPAASGSGKSTLTAALVASGLDYYTDDLALLRGNPLRLVSAPTRIGIKQGSWTALESRIPELAPLPTYRRSDGRLIKYHLPRNLRSPAPHPPDIAIAALVFPRYVAGAAMSFGSISRAEAFVRFTAAGYDLPNSLDWQWVRRMVEWIDGLQCYALTYGELSDATEAVKRLVS